MIFFKHKLETLKDDKTYNRLQSNNLLNFFKVHYLLKHRLKVEKPIKYFLNILKVDELFKLK